MKRGSNYTPAPSYGQASGPITTSFDGVNAEKAGIAAHPLPRGVGSPPNKAKLDQCRLKTNKAY